MNANGSGQTQLTSDPNRHDELPDWSPDGSKIAYMDVINGLGRIFVMNADGSHQTQVDFGPCDDFEPGRGPTAALDDLGVTHRNARRQLVCLEDAQPGADLDRLPVPERQRRGGFPQVRPCVSPLSWIGGATDACRAGTGDGRNVEVGRLHRMVLVSFAAAVTVGVGWVGGVGHANRTFATSVARAISGPVGVSVGSGGTVWFTNAGNNSIGRLDRDGVLNRFTATGVERPWGITVGPDDAVWFTCRGSDAIGRISTDGRLRLFHDRSIKDPVGITAGPDGALWFTNYGGDSIGRITTAGAVTSFPDRRIRQPIGIVTGPDGALWVAINGTNAIGKLSPAGALRLFKGPAISHPRDISVGSDGALWFTNWRTNWGAVPNNPIGRITVKGAARSYPVKGVQSAFAITDGPGASLSFTNPTTHVVGQITPEGTATVRIVDADPLEIVLGPDHTLWFTSRVDDSIGAITTAREAHRYTDPNDEPDRIAAQGKRLFTASGCGGCHTLADAGTTGNVGPNLDDLKPTAALVQRSVTNGGVAMPGYSGTLSADQIQALARYVSQAARRGSHRTVTYPAHATVTPLDTHPR